MSETTPPQAACRLFQITESDLAELERVLPQWQDRMFDRIDNRLKVQIRNVQEILKNVRWNYGPPQEVHVISADTDIEELKRQAEDDIKHGRVHDHEDVKRELEEEDDENDHE